MSPRKKRRKEDEYRRRKRLGPWFRAGQIFIILGAIIIIVAAILNMVDVGFATEAWESYTFGFLGIPILSLVIAIVCGVILLWFGIDRRFADSLNLILYAVIVIIIAIVAGNVGGLICIIGAILIFFEVAARS